MAQPLLERLRHLASAAAGRRYVPPEELAYSRLKAKGFAPAYMIDVGAYQGEWTRLARRVFGDVPVLMVEAQSAKRSFLDKVCADLPNVRYEQTLLSRSSGQKVRFFEMETGSSMFPENSNVSRVEQELVTATLDEIAGPVPAPPFSRSTFRERRLRSSKAQSGLCARVRWCSSRLHSCPTTRVPQHDRRAELYGRARVRTIRHKRA